jgi:hypothetical protein
MRRGKAGAGLPAIIWNAGIISGRPAMIESDRLLSRMFGLGVLSAAANRPERRLLAVASPIAPLANRVPVRRG